MRKIKQNSKKKLEIVNKSKNNSEENLKENDKICEKNNSNNEIEILKEFQETENEMSIDGLINKKEGNKLDDNLIDLDLEFRLNKKNSYEQLKHQN